MRKFTKYFLSLLLAFTIFPNAGIAATEIEQPHLPAIYQTISNEEMNSLIDEYNKQVDKYNKNVKIENEKLQQTYEKEMKEVEEYNQKEQEKVDKNTEDLEAQEKREQRIAEDSIAKTANSTTLFEELPVSWMDDNVSPVTIGINEGTAADSFQILNLHIYAKDSETYVGSDVTNNSFKINIDPESFIMAEWECVSTSSDSIVDLYSESKFYPSSGAVFTRFLEGYTNGYWMPATEEFVSTANDVWDNWGEYGPCTSFSYENGTTDGLSVPNTLHITIYNFTRKGKEPANVELYVPTFKEYPDEPELLPYLDKLDYVDVQEDKDIIFNNNINNTSSNNNVTNFNNSTTNNNFNNTTNNINNTTDNTSQSFFDKTVKVENTINKTQANNPTKKDEEEKAGPPNMLLEENKIQQEPQPSLQQKISIINDVPTTSTTNKAPATTVQSTSPERAIENTTISTQPVETLVSKDTTKLTESEKEGTPKTWDDSFAANVMIIAYFSLVVIVVGIILKILL